MEDLFFDIFTSCDWHKAFKQDILCWIYPYLELSSFSYLTTKWLDDIHKTTGIKWGKPTQSNPPKPA